MRVGSGRSIFLSNPVSVDFIIVMFTTSTEMGWLVILRWVMVTVLGRQFSVVPESLMVIVMAGSHLKLDKLLIKIIVSLLLLLSIKVLPMSQFQLLWA